MAVVVVCERTQTHTLSWPVGGSFQAVIATRLTAVAHPWVRLDHLSTSRVSVAETTWKAADEWMASFGSSTGGA